jgi:hypothetical protein
MCWGVWRSRFGGRYGRRRDRYWWGGCTCFLNPPRLSDILRAMDFQELPVSYGQWESGNPSGSFRLFAEFIHAQAKQYLLQDKTHAEMLFFMPLDGNGRLVLCQGEDRDAMAEWVRGYINKHYTFGLVHVCEAWGRFAENPKDHTLIQLEAGEMKVSDLKPEHRKEVLSVSAQARDGFAMYWLDEMIRDKKGALKLGKCHKFTDLEGRFGKLFG